MEESVRQCATCDVVKPVTEFHSDGMGHRRWSCKTCRAFQQRRARTGYMSVYQGPALAKSMRVGRMRSEWMTEAVCATVDEPLWFSHVQVEQDAAKAICEGCPVRDECLSWALTVPEVLHVWGGMSARQRKTLRGRSATATGLAS